MSTSVDATFSKEKLKLLAADFGSLSDYDSGLPNRVLGYVTRGEPSDILAELRGKARPGKRIKLISSGERFPTLDRRLKFFSSLDPVGVGPYLRLAKVYEACLLAGSKQHLAHPQCPAVWLPIIVEEATQATRNQWPPGCEPTGLTCELLEGMLEADGHPASLLLDVILEQGDTGFGPQRMQQMCTALADIGVYLSRHAARINVQLGQGDVKARLALLNLVQRVNCDVAPFLSGLVKCALDSSKQLREVSAPLLKKVATEAQAVLEERAKSGDRTEREHSVRLLDRFYGEKTAPVLRSLLETEKSQPVREVIEAALRGSTGLSSSESASLEPPPYVPIERNPPVTPALQQALASLCEALNLRAEQHNAVFAANQANPQNAQYIYPNAKIAPLTDHDVTKLVRMVETEETGAKREHLGYFLRMRDEPALRAILQHPDCQLIHVVRLLRAFGLLRGQHQELDPWAAIVISMYRETHETTELRHVAEALAAVGFKKSTLAELELDSYGAVFRWPAEAIWPYFINHLAEIENALQPASGDYMQRWRMARHCNSAFRILGTFPVVPEQFVGRLWDFAIGTNKADRARAQPIVVKLPDLTERLAQSLASGAFQTRQAAAEFAGAVGDKALAPALHAAAKKEKQDAALDAILTALEKLGEDIAPYLDREKLRKDAEKNLKKGVPPALAWFAFDQLPSVHWADTRESVPKEVLTWLVVQSFKLKTAAAGPLLRRYCAQFDDAERKALGDFVLAAWLAKDLERKYTDEEARAAAQQEAAQTWASHGAYYQQHPQYGFPQSQQAVEEQIYKQYIATVGSAVAEKGILAVAGACCGAAAVDPVQRYLKEYYGYRAAQCKALLGMLSTSEEPLAIQYLLYVSNRFRTKSIREEAERIVQELAERKGWTLDELADRTLTTAGFDDDGQLELDYGPRKFTARVNAKLEVVLTDSDGKALKSLPDARKDDDPELAKAAKKTFTAAKSELKKFAGLQRDRLYEAMCTQRAWPLADWRMYLFAHPLLKFLCQRLVWGAYDADGALVTTFRPLDDGTLTDVEDNPVDVSAAATIRLVHGCQLPAEVAQAWNRHLADYDISPLFAQFNRAKYELPEDKRRAQAIRDYEGYMVEAFTLRNLATKAGYIRGQTEDGGWFYEYQKSFPGLGLVARISFSGSGLPEENRPVALTQLSFTRKGEGEAPTSFRREQGVPLGDLPEVLLAECVGDLAAIAAAGSGRGEDEG